MQLCLAQIYSVETRKKENARNRKKEEKIEGGITVTKPGLSCM